MAFIDWELKIDALNKRRRERMRQSGEDDKSFALGTLAKWVPESADMPHFQQQAFLEYLLPAERSLIRTMDLESIVRKELNVNNNLMDLSIHEDDTSEDDEEDPPASEELFFDDNEVDAYDRLCNSDQNVVKPLTSNQKHLLGLLANCTIESYDNPIMQNHKRRFRLELVRQHVKLLKRKRFNQSYKRFMKVRAKHLDLHEEATELKDREVDDKHLLEKIRDATEQNATFLQSRINAIHKKYELYAADPKFRQIYQNRTYFNVHLAVPSGDTLHMPDTPMWAQLKQNIPNVTNIADVSEPVHAVSIDSTLNPHTLNNSTVDTLFLDNLTQDANNEINQSQENPENSNALNNSTVDSIFLDNQTQDVNYTNQSQGNPPNHCAHLDDILEEDLEDVYFKQAYAAHINDLIAVKQTLFNDIPRTNPENSTQPVLPKQNSKKNAPKRSPTKKRQQKSKVDSTYRESIFMQTRTGLVNRHSPLPPKDLFQSADAQEYRNIPSSNRNVNPRQKFEEWQQNVLSGNEPITSSRKAETWETIFDKNMYEMYCNEAFQSYQEESGYAIAERLYQLKYRRP